jgi:hypothetical protein
MNSKKFSEAMGELDNKYVDETINYKKKVKKPGWIKWGAMVACLCLVVCVLAIPRLFEKSNNRTSGDLSPMICVNNTLYRMASNQPDITGKESQLVYLGTILSKVSSSQYPQENFQANDDIVGSVVYQFGEDIVVEIDGDYWSYCAVLDVDYTTNDDGTYTCRGNTYKYMFEVSGVDGESQVTYIILSNSTETSFEEVRYSLIKAEMSTGTPEFVILGWYY